MQQRVLNQGAEPGVSYLKAGDESGLSELNKKGVNTVKTPKWLNAKGPFFENGTAYARVTVKRWAWPWLLWRASKKNDCSLRLHLGKMNIDLTWFIRLLIVAKLSIKQVFGVS